MLNKCKYINGESEEIISKLAIEPTLKMYTLSLISMEIIKPELINNKGFSNLEQAVDQSPGVYDGRALGCPRSCQGLDCRDCCSHRISYQSYWLDYRSSCRSGRSDPLLQRRRG